MGFKDATGSCYSPLSGALQPRLVLGKPSSDDLPVLHYAAQTSSPVPCGRGLPFVPRNWGAAGWASTILSLPFVLPPPSNVSLWGSLHPTCREATKTGNALPTPKGPLGSNLTPSGLLGHFYTNCLLYHWFFCDVNLQSQMGLVEEDNQLLTASRKTLTAIRVLNCESLSRTKYTIRVL